MRKGSGEGPDLHTRAFSRRPQIVFGELSRRVRKSPAGGIFSGWSDRDRTAGRRPRDSEARQAGRMPRPPGTRTGRQARREGLQ